MNSDEYYQKEIKRLKEIIGSWRRKAQEQGFRRECIREGYDDYRGIHYKVYAVQDIPENLEMKEVLEELKCSFLPSVFPYRFERCDYSRKFSGWLVQVGKDLDVNMDPLQSIRKSGKDS